MKYQRFTQSSCKDIEIRKFGFVTKTQLLCRKLRRRKKFRKTALYILSKIQTVCKSNLIFFKIWIFFYFVYFAYITLLNFAFSFNNFEINMFVIFYFLILLKFNKISFLTFKFFKIWEEEYSNRIYSPSPPPRYSDCDLTHFMCK